MGTTTFSGPVVSPGGFSTTTTAGVVSAGLFSGAGAPSGTVTAAKGSLYMNTSASSTTTRLYINTDGGTTWTTFTTAA